MSLNWIQVGEFSFNSMLLLERFQLRYLFGKTSPDAWRSDLGLALHHNPSVLWYVAHRCPECAVVARALAAAASTCADDLQIREAELAVMRGIEDFVTYTRPEIMDESCPFIYAWDRRRLLEMADFAGTRVLDVGSGSGRLAFAAAEIAKEVYASEPVSTLREYLRDRIAREGIRNVRVVDGMVECLPYPDDTFDITMSGHVLGDDYDAEIAELTRVTKPGGWILDCPGDEAVRGTPDGELVRRGWEPMYYPGSLSCDVYRHRIQVKK